MRAKKIDSNQNSIVTQLCQIPGVSVLILSAVGHGCPDLLIGYKARNYLIELKDGEKTESKKRLTDDEQKFHNEWTGQVAKCETLDEILKILNITNQ